MIRQGAAFCLIVGIAACGGAPFSAIGSVDAGALDEVLVDVHQADAGADVSGEVLDAHQVDEQLDEVLVDVHQVDAGADVVDEQLDAHQVDEQLDAHQVDEQLDAHQVDEQLDEVLVDVLQVDAGADVVDEVLVDAACSHVDGMGQSFTACATDAALARDACAAYAAATPGAMCGSVQLGCPGSGFGVCASSASACTCWEYAGPAAGHVHTAAACACATASDPGWG